MENDRLPGWSELPEEHVDLPEHRLRRSGLRIRRPVEPEGEATVGEGPQEERPQGKEQR